MSQRAAADPDRVLRQLLHALDELQQCLEDELQALASRELSPLLDVVERQRRALRSVNALVSRSPLHALLAPSEPRAEAADEALENLRSLPAWQEVLERLAACRHLNQAAGGSIAAARRSVDETLRLLGRAPQYATYGVDGNASAAPVPGRNLAVC